MEYYSLIVLGTFNFFIITIRKIRNKDAIIYECYNLPIAKKNLIYKFNIELSDHQVTKMELLH